ncbi:TOMM precursor leader peptide-binding protein [Streptomyces sp. NPDC050560]|uniref:TOMM precursor leader peptide-binding protein n=1 Tax=Streptomyces sp. NPDC050560 TaxID=3365630 RepID=UPI0037B5804A
MHPLLRPSLRRAWRDLNTVQFGITPGLAQVLSPVSTATGTFLTLLDGTRGLPLLREEARRMGLPEGHADEVVRRLAAAGLLDDATGGGLAAAALRGRPALLDRLRPDLAALSLGDPDPDSGIAGLGTRLGRHVQVRGAGRVGALLAAVLAAAGVGHVDVRDGGEVEPWDTAPGGHPPQDVGHRRDESARAGARRAAPDRPSAPAPSTGEAGLGLVVLAPRDGLGAWAPHPSATADLVAAGTPHLHVGVIERTGVVGPLVLPGTTGCAGCLDLHRVDRDPAWPRMLAQWRSGRQRHVVGGEVALTTTVAGHAAAQALAFLGGTPPGATGARWEVSAPGFDWRRARVRPHPHCPCGAARHGDRQAGGTRATVDGEGRATMSG